MLVSFHPWQTTWLEEDPSLVPTLEKAKEKPDQGILVLWNQVMIALMVMKLTLQLLAKIVLRVVLLSLRGDVPSDEGHSNAIPQFTLFIRERGVKLPITSQMYEKL